MRKRNEERLRKEREDALLKEKMLTDKQRTVTKLRGQNDTLKVELKTLSNKLEEFVNASRIKR
jgi:hypothetical protein